MKKLLITLLAIGASVSTYAQLDPLYNQYLFNQSMINPAYAGIHDVLNATIISRSQWTGIEGAPITNSVNISSSLLDNSGGIGLLYVNDKYGVNSNTEIQGMFSYRIEMLRGRVLSMGVQGGMISYGYNYDLLNTEFVNDPQLVADQDDFTKGNFGAGVFYMTPNYYIGMSVPRLLKADIQDGDIKSTRYRRHYYVSAGIILDKWMSVKFKPSALLKVVEGKKTSMDLTAQVLLKESLWLGVTVRDFNAAGFTAQFEISDQFRVGYTFEVPLSKLAPKNFGTHELMLSYDMEIFGNHAVGRRYF